VAIEVGGRHEKDSRNANPLEEAFYDVKSLSIRIASARPKSLTHLRNQ
jgi:hypothetical protein